MTGTTILECIYTRGRMKNGFFVKIGLVSLLSASSAFAGGYELLEQSPRGLGQAFAGRSTGFGDGSEVYYNPAAMKNIKGKVFTVGANIISPEAKFKNEGSSLVPALGGDALTGGNGGNGGAPRGTGNLYYVRDVADRFKFGLGINSLFGLASYYDPKWVGRYHAVKSNLQVINFVPALSIEMTDAFSIGIGMNNMYMDAELTNAVDFGTIGATTLGAAKAASLGLTPQNADGFGKVSGNDWAHGIILGANIDVTKATKLGFAYRGKIEGNIKGHADFTVPQAASILTSTGAFTSSEAWADVTLPETFSAGISNQVTDDWTVFLEGTWTRWSRFQELAVEYDTVQPDTITQENWETTWRVAGGVNIKHSPCLTLRAGFAYEESPVNNNSFRTPRIPDNDRVWATLGWGWQVSDNLVLDVAYAHLTMRDGYSANANSTGAVLAGKYELGIDIVSAGLTWNWE